MARVHDGRCEVEFRGGPLDGARRPVDSFEPWIDVAGFIYQLCHDGGYTFAGTRARVCDCGALLKPRSDEESCAQCPLCGARR